MDQKTLSILLQMGVDEAAATKGLAKFTEYQKQINALEAKARELLTQMAKALDQGENVDELQKELVTVGAALERVRKASKEALVDGFQTDAERATAEAKKFTDQIKEAEKQAFLLRDIGEKLGQVGGRLAGAGQSILSPFLDAQNAYLQAQQAQAGMDATAQRWNQAQQEIDQARARIGQTTTQELLPMIEAVADLTTRIADLLEKNPDLVKLALGAGIGLQAGGTLLQTVGSLASLIGTLKGLGLIGSAGTAAGTATGTAVSTAVLAPIVTSVLAILASVGGGIALGVGVYDQVAEKTGRAKSNQIATGGAYELGQLFGKIAGLDDSEIERKATVFAAVIGKMTGAIDENSPLWQRAQASIPDQPQSQLGPTTDQLAAFDAYQQAVTAREEFERQSEDARTQIVQAQGAERVALESQYGAQRVQALADFARSQARLEEDYYRQRSLAVRNYNKATQRAEEDHQRQMARMRREHLERVDDLERSRDALGLVKEQRNYEQARNDAEQDYQVAARRRSEDFADQLAQMDANFQTQEQRRQEDFDLQLAKMDAQHAAEMARFDQNAATRLKAFDAQYKKELEQLQTNETNRLNILRQAALNDQSATQNAAARLTAQYKAWLERNMSSLSSQRTYYGGRAAGGYAYADGTYRMAEQGREFVLNNATTMAAERMMGGSLSQDTFLRAISRSGRGGGLGGRSLSIRSNATFNGAFSDAEKAAMRGMVQQAAESAVAEMLGLEER